MTDIEQIEQEIDWFMGDKENEAILVKHIPDLIAEVKRLRNKNINYVKLIDDITLWIAKSPYESDYIIAFVDEKMSEIHLGVEEE